ncbi:MAG: hybrid sensor histidine kinase/response regulator [Planctomycetota bacterium]|nr:hybrid sensor histidine kinase/response regulator [Planctomycetota bacterium]
MAKVVLIDDEPRLLATLARFLEREGVEVVMAASFAEADEHLQPGRFEVLVTDIVMPAFDGMRVLREVVSVRQCQEPVIMITGLPNLETASQAVRNGAFDYIQKPVTKDRLLEVVNRGLRHVKLLRERDQARQRELQLLKNLAEIGESASVLSHEIKTPINGLRHALRAVGDKLGVEDGVVIGEFVGSLGRIERLLGETLSFAKPLMPRLSEVSLRDVIDGAVGECQRLDTFTDMAIEVLCDRSLRLEVDSQHLGEVCVNLLKNAAEACAGTGSIGVSAQATDESVCIDFADSGPGVPVRMRDKIFKPFFSSKDYGTGIGLAFCRKIVEAHGGSIELLSRECGACFRVKLPMKGVVEGAGPVRGAVE